MKLPAIIVDVERDNVALAVSPIAPGRYTIARGDLDVVEPVAPGQRIALGDVPAGAFLVQYGCPFAVSRGINRGFRVDPDRVERVLRALRVDGVRPDPVRTEDAPVRALPPDAAAP